MAWSKTQFRARYNRLAPFYDKGLWLYRAAGLRIDAYRQEAVHALRLSPGDTVVDLGCATGNNFPYLHAAVGPSGRIIGVDLAPAMLVQAERRARRAGWANVTLEEGDLSVFDLPPGVDGVLATLALGTVPDYDAVVARLAKALSGGARIADLELQWPERWPPWLARLAAALNRPLGVTSDVVHRRPADAIERYFNNAVTREVYFGAGYICSGAAPDQGDRHVRT